MIDVSAFMNMFLEKLTHTFGERVWFVGLQGSYARGEATNTSDIDTVVILDELSAEDIRTYNAMLDTLPHRPLMCGFLSGKNELLNWDTSDLFQFYHDTKPLYGSLDALLPLIDKPAIDRAIKIGVCNIYHGCVHNMLYDKSVDILKGLYKSTSFVLQAIVFKNTGSYVPYQDDLLETVSNEERVILDTFLRLKHGTAVDFDEASNLLFAWAKKRIEFHPLGVHCKRD